MLWNACWVSTDSLNCLGVILQPLRIIKDYMNFCNVELRIWSNKSLQQEHGVVQHVGVRGQRCCMNNEHALKNDYVWYPSLRKGVEHNLAFVPVLKHSCDHTLVSLVRHSICFGQCTGKFNVLLHSCWL